MSNTIGIWHDIVRQISKLIPLNLKQRKKNHTYTSSNILTAKKNTKQTVIYISFGNVNLIKNNTQRNTRSFVRTEANQSTQLWARKVYDYERPKIFLTECLKE